ncbi:hypothetical protein [Nonomuraea sp. NPDC050202]|uniref:hypothetical protein n=1 Tax=Nonomuraea sp. NPDC050202 TaxID=3155035 RepID=UPI003401C83D
MPVKVFSDGDRPTAADFNRHFMQQVHALKTADESVVSSTTMQDDDHLFVPVDANTVYWVTALILYSASTAGDLKIGWSGPGGTSFEWVSDGFGSASSASGVDTVSRSYQTLGNTPAPGGNGTGVIVSCIPRGVLITGGSAGTFRFRFAQLASDPGATTVRAESILILRRLTD